MKTGSTSVASLAFSDDSNYEIANNVLKRIDGSKFDADFFMGSKKVDPASSVFDHIVIGGEVSSSNGRSNFMQINGGNISMMGGGKNQVQINGVAITMSGNKISLKTSKSLEIEVNGVKYLPSDSSINDQDKDDDKGYSEIDFKAANLCIDEISISGSGGVAVNNSPDVFDRTDGLSVNIKGSGDVHLSDIGMESLHLNVMGSGGIKVKNTVIQNCNAQVMGSGDITFDSSCRATKMNASVMGSGDIRGGGMSAHKVSKKVMGSGDITGFQNDM